MIKTHENITLETQLSVKEAAALTQMSIPTFYTPKRRADFGFPEDGSAPKTWRISVADLVAHGLLTSDLRPLKNRKMLCSHIDYDFVISENAELKSEIELLNSELAHLKLLAEERGQHIEMLAKLMGVVSA